VLSSLPAFGPHLNSYTVDNNLTLQESLYRLRAETKDAFDEAKALEARWKDLEREQKEVYQVRQTHITSEEPLTYSLQRFTPQFLLMRLRHATTAQDDESEALASLFVQSGEASNQISSNGKDIDDFVKEFKASRKQYHKRVMWGDRWANGQVTWRDD
jgi:ESCRT-I complex subunit VPS37